MKDRPNIMSRLAARRPSPAMIVALMALFASTGGVSYALATGSIGSREIKNNAIRGKDIRNNSLTNKDLGRRELDGTNIKKERVGGDAVKEQVLESEKIGKVSEAAGADTLGGQTAEQIIAAGKGNTGPAGPVGPAGSPGPSGVSGVEVVRTEFTVADGTVDSVYANCPAGRRATGGGVGAIDGGSPSDRIVQSGPVDSSGGFFSDTETGDAPVSWFGGYFNGSGASTTAYVWAICG
jgi:hypothetical protein